MEHIPQLVERSEEVVLIVVVVGASADLVDDGEMEGV